MASVFEKLNLKAQHQIVVLNAPESFERELLTLANVEIVRDPARVASIEFALAFATTQAEVDRLAASLAPRSVGDAILWFAYPKGTSRRYKCDFNRDTGWGALRRAGFDTVRQIAIDDDWTALRFRRNEYIKSAAR